MLAVTESKIWTWPTTKIAYNGRNQWILQSTNSNTAQTRRRNRWQL